MSKLDRYDMNKTIQGLQGRMVLVDYIYRIFEN